jgi:hypothetical protein
MAAPLAPLAAQASGGNGSDMSIGLRFGTLGIGGEIAKLVTSNIGLRVGANFFSLDHTFNQSDVSIDGTVKLKAVTGLVDFFPASRGSFHLTAGVMTNPAEVTGTGVPTSSGTFTLNHQTYSAAQVGTLTGSGKWSSALPYLGFGFGTPAGHHTALRFVFDVGVGIGKPAVLINASGASTNATLAADVAAQQDTLQAKFNKLPVYPAVSFGLVVRF